MYQPYLFTSHAKGPGFDFLVDDPWFYIVWLYPDVVYKLQNKEYFLSFRNFRAKGVSFYMALPLCEGLPFSSRLNGQF